MATSLKEFSTTAASNTAVGSANVAEGCPPAGINNAIREFIAYVVDWLMNTGTIASASTTDIGTKTQSYLAVSGTTTITSFGTPTNKTEYTLKFDGALILTHNGTSLILPGGANVTTIAGELAKFRHEGSGNWRCVSYPPRWLYGDGTAGQVLTSAGSGSVATWSSGGGAYTTKTSGYTIIATDNADVIDFTTAGVTATLTAAATLGSGFMVTIMNTAASGDVTIDPNGTETLDGLTTRLLRPGDRVTIVCDGSNWKTLRGVYSFESAEQTVALSTVYTVAHGLGEKPTFVRVVVRCKTTEGGWAVGDEIDVTAASVTYGKSVAADATNVIFTQNQAYQDSYGNKSTGANFYITADNWKFVAYARKVYG